MTTPLWEAEVVAPPDRPRLSLALQELTPDPDLICDGCQREATHQLRQIDFRTNSYGFLWYCFDCLQTIASLIEALAEYQDKEE